MENRIIESTQDRERQKLIENVTLDAARYLSVDIHKDSAHDIVNAVNETITNIVLGEPIPIPAGEEFDLLLGCLWGSQMVRELDWSWVDIRADGTPEIGIVSPSRDMVIYPFTFVANCIAKRCICTVMLSFNMLFERKDSPVFEPQGYEDVMKHIKHIVPPYELETKG